MEPRLHVFRQGDGQRFLYYNEITKEGQLQGSTTNETAAVTEPGVPPTNIPIFAPIPVEAATVQPPASDPGTPVQILPTSSSYSDPSIEIDYYGIQCKALYTLMSSTQSMMSQAKLTTAAYQYYTKKVAEMQMAYNSRGCRVGLDVIDPTNGTTSTSTDNQTATNPTTVTTPVLTTDPIVGTPVVTAAASTDTPAASTPLAAGAPTGGGGGGGGGGSSAPTPTPAARKKPDFKKDWLLWLVAAAALGLSIYKGRNTELKFSSK